MATLSIQLPDPIKSWIDAQADAGAFKSADGYVLDLIQRDRERSDKIAAMQRLVDEARASGLSEETVEDVRARAKARLRARS